MDLQSALATVLGMSGYGGTGSTDPALQQQLNDPSQGGPPLNLPPNYGGVPPTPNASAGTMMPPPPSGPGGVFMPVPAPGPTPQPTLTGTVGPTPNASAGPMMPPNGAAPAFSGQPIVIPRPPGGAPPPGQPLGPAVRPPPGQPPAGPWLSNILGSDPRQNAQMVNSLAAGLSSVGQNWNKPGLAAFAGSAGAAVQGGARGDTEFLQKTAQAKLDELRFTQEGDREKVDQARMKYWQDRMDLAQKQGTVSSRADAWRNSDLGKISAADDYVLKWGEELRKQYPADLKDTDNAEGTRAKIAAAIAQKREEVYRERGIDPAGAAKAKTRGTEDNPHPKPASRDEFNAVVKPGQWFINPSNGKKLQRSMDPVPPPADAPGGVLATTPPDLQSVPPQMASYNNQM